MKNSITLFIILIIMVLITSCRYDFIRERGDLDYRGNRSGYSLSIKDISLSAIEAAKANLHIAYGHTSHGQQLVNGLEFLDDFMAANGTPAGTYAVVFDGSAGIGELDLYDIPWRPLS